jgi:hypothetical protein
VLYGAVATSTPTNNGAAGVVGNNNLGAAGNWLGATTFSALVSTATSNLYSLNADPTATAIAPVTQIPGVFTYDYAANTLAWNVPSAPAVPEPGTYAMLLAGLAAVGLVVKRRSAV